MKVFENEERVKAYIREKENWYLDEIETRKELLSFYGIEWGEVKDLVKQCKSIVAKKAKRQVEFFSRQEIIDDDLKKYTEGWTQEDWRNRKKVDKAKDAISKYEFEHRVRNFCQTRLAIGEPLPKLAKGKDLDSSIEQWVKEHKEEAIDTLSRSAEELYDLMLDFGHEDLPFWVQQILAQTALAIFLIEEAENVKGVSFLEIALACPDSFDIAMVKSKKLDKMKWDGRTFNKPVGRKRREDHPEVIQWIVDPNTNPNPETFTQPTFEQLRNMISRDRNTSIMEIFKQHDVKRVSDKTCDEYWKLAVVQMAGRK